MRYICECHNSVTPRQRLCAPITLWNLYLVLLYVIYYDDFRRCLIGFWSNKVWHYVFMYLTIYRYLQILWRDTKCTWNWQFLLCVLLARYTHCKGFSRVHHLRDKVWIHGNPSLNRIHYIIIHSNQIFKNFHLKYAKNDTHFNSISHTWSSLCSPILVQNVDGLWLYMWDYVKSVICSPTDCLLL